MKSICVYCGSNAGNRPIYAERAVALGQRIAHEGLALIYGGGNVGLMGLAADAALAAGGEVIAAACIVDRSGGKADVGVPLIALASLDVPAYPADALPPELAALPVEDPGSRRLSQ